MCGWLSAEVGGRLTTKTDDWVDFGPFFSLTQLVLQDELLRPLLLIVNI